MTAEDASFFAEAFHALTGNEPSPWQEELYRRFVAGQPPKVCDIPTGLGKTAIIAIWLIALANTQAKLPRLVSSCIRAFNVHRLTRGAVYIPPLDYSELDVFSEEDKAKAEGNNKSPLAQRGFVHNPASGAHGGVIAYGGIRRDATLGLAALRHLQAGKEGNSALALRRYILGLSLVAFTAHTECYLRQGCTLVVDPEEPREFVEVHPDGKREPCKTTHEAALAFASEAAKEFGVGESRTVPFEKKLAQQDVKGDDSGKGKAKRRGKKAEGPADQPEDN